YIDEPDEALTLDAQKLRDAWQKIRVALSAPAPRAEALGRLLRAVEGWKKTIEMIVLGGPQEGWEAVLKATEFELAAAWEEWRKG
ncbi:MAG: hypothetical protein V2A77_10050, partial [Pseudomonadota bacterium]